MKLSELKQLYETAVELGLWPVLETDPKKDFQAYVKYYREEVKPHNG